MSRSSIHARPVPGGRIAYVNGRYLPHREACVHVEDRGLQFADSIYEVCAVIDRRLMDEEGHLDRLDGPVDPGTVAPGLGQQYSASSHRHAPMVDEPGVPATRAGPPLPADRGPA